MKALVAIFLKFSFNLINGLCPSSLLRAHILRLFGAQIGNRVKVEKITLMHYEGFNLSHLILGNRVYIGPGAILDLKESIIIGKSTKIGPGCNISTHVDAGKENEVSSQFPAKKEAVMIGSGVWIGASTTILCGTVIGDNAVIGACSLVRSDIPEGGIAYGVPAKVKK